MVQYYLDQITQQDAARLLMRELLDNEQRAEKAGNWYLKSYLETLVDLACNVDLSLSRAEAVAVVYQLLGAANYLALSQPTLQQIFGKTLFRSTCRAFEGQLRQLIRARLRPSRR